MHEAAATPAWVLLAYLISGVCFILALRGLSSPTSSRRGNYIGMVGMAIAVVTTLVVHVGATPICVTAPANDPTYGDRCAGGEFYSFVLIPLAIIIGGGIGLVTARKIQMTAMPQLVAAFHSLVGMAAVLVGAAAYLNPEAFGIAQIAGSVGEGWTVYAPTAEILINPVSRVEMGLGIAIGAITFSGSVIAFLKLNGNMSGKPILLPLRHVINLGILAGILGLIAYFTTDQSPWVFFTVMG